MAEGSAVPRTSMYQPGGRPLLSELQLAVLDRYGTEQRVAIDDVLFRDAGRIERDLANRECSGVQGTPTFYVNGVCIS